MKLWLDDLRVAPEGWEWYTDAYSFIYALDEDYEKVTHISLDHDLGNKELFGDGYQVMQWIERMVYEGAYLTIPDISFHSANPVGVLNMENALESIKCKLD